MRSLLRKKIELALIKGLITQDRKVMLGAHFNLGYCGVSG